MKHPPKYLPGDIIRYKKAQAHIFEVYSSGDIENYTWRYGVEIKRGKNRGVYSLTERELPK